MDPHRLTYTYIIPYLRRLKNSDGPVIMSISSIKTLVSNSIFQKKKPEPLGEQVDARTEARDIQNYPGESCTRKGISAQNTQHSTA